MSRNEYHTMTRPDRSLRLDCDFRFRRSVGRSILSQSRWSLPPPLFWTTRAFPSPPAATAFNATRREASDLRLGPKALAVPKRHSVSKMCAPRLFSPRIIILNLPVRVAYLIFSPRRGRFNKKSEAGLRQRRFEPVEPCIGQVDRETGRVSAQTARKEPVQPESQRLCAPHQCHVPILRPSH